MSSLPTLSKKEILEWVDDERIFDRGLDYFQSGSIFNTRRQGSTLRANCRGSERKPYQLWVRFDKRGIKDAECSCPYDFECKHLVALLFQWLAKPETFLEEEPTPSKQKAVQEEESILVEQPIKINLNDLPSSLAALLKKVKRPGEFYASGGFATILPRIDIEKVGPLSFPIPNTQAEQIISVAERAPYGKGGETLVDTEVRRVWQLSPQKIKIDAKRWAPTMEKIVAEVSKGLGVDGKVEAELYKMLIYDKGSFFVPHRDTEKTPGMFGTLIVVLPSWYEGGELVVSHAGREARLALPPGDASEISWAAFYADCLHELRPVTEGYRLALVYNLLRAGKGKPPSPPDRRPESAQVAKLLTQWSAALLGKNVGSLPTKLAYVLEHHYTPESLSFAALKNEDAARADVLKSATREANCDLHLAMVSIEESGSAEYNGDGGYGDYYGDEDEEDGNDSDFEISEVCDRSQKIEQWRTIDDVPANLAPLPFEDSEISPPDSLDSEESDDVNFHEASGNEGASFERTYRRAALVLWPKHRVFAVINQGGLKTTMPYLSQLIEQWKKSAEPSHTSDSWQEADIMAGWMIGTWPAEEQSGWDRDEQREAKMLALLNQLSSAERLRSFISEVSSRLHYSGKENHELVVACERLGWEEGLSLMKLLVEKRRIFIPEACAQLLDLLSQKIGPAQISTFIEAVRPLVDGLSEDKFGWGILSEERRSRSLCLPREEFIVHLLGTLWRVNDSSLAEQATAYISRNLKRFPVDDVLLPAVLTLTEQKTKVAPGYQPLQEACIAHLKARISLLLEAPKNWTRAPLLSCSCKDCQEIKTFLADPAKKDFDFRAAETRRKHVLYSISADCDMSTTTIKTGSPHALRCTKNSNSYKRACAQRERDLAALKKLSAL